MGYEQKIIKNVVKQLRKEGKPVPPEFLKKKKRSFLEFLKKTKSDVLVSLDDCPFYDENDDFLDILSQESIPKIINRFIYYSRLKQKTYLYNPEKDPNYPYIVEYDDVRYVSEPAATYDKKEEIVHETYIPGSSSRSSDGRFVLRESILEYAPDPYPKKETKQVPVVHHIKREKEAYEVEQEIFEQSLKDYLKDPENTVCEFINRKASEKHLSNTKIYKDGNMSKQTFSKIISNQTKQPSFESCIQLALGLKLNLKDTNELLRLAGKAFSDSYQHRFIKLYIDYNHHDYDKLNNLLDEYNLPTIRCD